MFQLTKRAFVKLSGLAIANRILPGRLLMAHGGVLDRFDALMFATVAAYFVTVALT